MSKILRGIGRVAKVAVPTVGLGLALVKTIKRSPTGKIKVDVKGVADALEPVVRAEVERRL
jgi:hypothetical protein